MIEDKVNPKISVYIITYNQEEVIERTLGSILSQRDYVYEICVSDDHSTDRTWDILLDYKNKYPGLFKLNRNNPNLGIFKNTEKVWSMTSGDVVYDLAGDDSVGEGWFKTVIEFIKKNNIDYKNELFCIYGDYKCIYPNGDVLNYSQKAIQKQPHNALRLALRGIIGGRGCCFSKNVLNKFEIVSSGRSHKVEQVQDRQLQIHAIKNYYIPYNANIYYSGIGISTKIQNEEVYNDRLEIWPYTLEYLENKGIKLPFVDYNYGKYNIAIKKFLHHKSLINLMKVCFYYIISYDPRLPNYFGLKYYLFAILRRMPHKKAIVF